jgi:cell division topological specificity factor
MSLFSFFNRRTSAPVARERLQVLLAHERTVVGGESDLVATLREEIMAVIAKHMAVAQDNVQIKMDRGASVSTLEVEIEIPTSIAGMRPAA